MYIPEPDENEPPKPEWLRPVTSVLEIDEVTLNSGNNIHETGFSFS